MKTKVFEIVADQTRKKTKLNLNKSITKVKKLKKNSTTRK